MRARTQLRRTTALAFGLASLGGALATAAPAHATGIGCSFQRNLYVDPGVTVTGTEYYVCATSTTAMPVTLTRNGVTIATGTGSATYVCGSLDRGSFAVDGTGVGSAACGLNLN